MNRLIDNCLRVVVLPVEFLLSILLPVRVDKLGKLTPYEIQCALVFQFLSERDLLLALFERSEAPDEEPGEATDDEEPEETDDEERAGFLGGAMWIISNRPLPAVRGALRGGV